MAAIMNGLALHGGFIPFGGTFLTFSDYSRNAIRMAALMKLRVIHVFTHDSIGLGEDGPTHQAVEHVASLRLIPNLDVWRPCDTVETAVAWTLALRTPATAPTALLLSRQNLPFVPRDDAQRRRDRARRLRARRSRDGAPQRDPDRDRFRSRRSRSPRRSGSPPKASATRVVSMPSTETLRSPGRGLPRRACCPRGCRRSRSRPAPPRSGGSTCAATAASIGIDRFGESAPAGQLFEHFGFTAEKIAEAARALG